MKTLPLTQDWPIWNVSAIAKDAEQLEFKRGQTIFHQGDVANHFYFVKSGEVELLKDAPFNPLERFTLNSMSARGRYKSLEQKNLGHLNKYWRDDKHRFEVNRDKVSSVNQE